ncbi:MAG: hypothetical protein ACE147_17115 [Candidatus Methylomirabilales bacterium]
MATHARRHGWADRLERVARLIPGIGRYQDREGLRETDKRVRLYLAEQLAGLQRILERAQERLVDGKRLDRLTALDRVGRALSTAADRIRTASYGFSGVFDLQKVREGELADLHAYDVRLLEEVPKLKARLQALADAATAEAGFPEALQAAQAGVDALADALREREHIARRL